MISQSNKNVPIYLLSEDGHRLTRQKEAVLRALFDHDSEHLTIDEILVYSKNYMSSISISTVYKTLLYLEHLNILRKIRIADKACRYELIHPGEMAEHPHCICKRCGKTIGIQDDFVKARIDQCEQLSESLCQFKIDSRSVLFYGLCAECRKNGSG